MLTMENPSPTLETCGDLNGDDYRKNYSKSFQKFVDKCLLRDPEKRYSNSCDNSVNTIVERPSYCWCTCTYVSSYYMYMCLSAFVWIICSDNSAQSGLWAPQNPYFNQN